MLLQPLLQGGRLQVNWGMAMGRTITLCQGFPLHKCQCSKQPSKTVYVLWICFSQGMVLSIYLMVHAHCCCEADIGVHWVLMGVAGCHQHVFRAVCGLIYCKQLLESCWLSSIEKI